MSTIRAKVKDIRIVDDEMNMNPATETLTLEPIGCFLDQFIEWASYAGMQRSDLGLRCGDKLVYIDETSPYEVGDIIEVSFDEFFEGRLNHLHFRAKQIFDCFYKDTLRQLIGGKN